MRLAELSIFEYLCAREIAEDRQMFIAVKYYYNTVNVATTTTATTTVTNNNNNNNDNNIQNLYGPICTAKKTTVDSFQMT